MSTASLYKPWFFKDPDAVLDYGWDWADGGWLETGETITALTVTASVIAGDAAPLAVDSSAEAGGVTTAWLSGGTHGENYDVTFHVETSQGREDDRTIEIRCRHR